MNLVYTIISCLFVAAKAVLSAQQNRAEAVVNLYNEKLSFFDSFLAPSTLDSFSSSEENLEAVKNLGYANIPYTSLRGEIISWCVEVKNTPAEVDDSSTRLQRANELASYANKRLNEMKKYFDPIATNGQTKFNDDVNKGKNLITQALTEISGPSNGAYDRESMLTKCQVILNKLASPGGFDSLSPSKPNPPSTPKSNPPSMPESNPSASSTPKPNNGCGINSPFSKKSYYIYAALLGFLHYAKFVTFFST